MEPVAIILAVAVGLLAAWAIRSFVIRTARRSRVAEEIVGMVSSDERIRNVLGPPVRRSGAVAGSLDVTSDGWRALLAIPIAGSDRRAILYVDGVRKTDRWRFGSVTLQLEPRAIELAPVPTRVDGAVY